MKWNFILTESITDKFLVAIFNQVKIVRKINFKIYIFAFEFKFYFHDKKNTLQLKNLSLYKYQFFLKMKFLKEQTEERDQLNKNKIF